LSVRVSLGHFECTTAPATFENGMCRWNQIIETPDLINFPEDLTQLPDIFVYLMKGDKPVCFTLVK
jgi:hypothetical protein